MIRKKNSITISSSEVVNLDSSEVVLEHLLEGSHVADGQVHDVDVVSDPSAVNRLVVAAVDLQQRPPADRHLHIL